MHQSIKGSKLTPWVNNFKRLHKVPNDLLNRYSYEIWCNDRTWAETLLNRGDRNVAITSLLECSHSDGKIGHPCVFISPNSIQYMRRSTSPEGFENPQGYVRNIAVLHKSANTIAPPTNIIQSSYLERLSKKNPPACRRPDSYFTFIINGTVWRSSVWVTPLTNSS